MAIKALPRRGNSWNAEKYYQALGHPMDHGAQILNLSLGGGFDPGERDIIQDLIAAGVIVVAAMGNEFEEGNPTSFPAAYDDVIAVGATDEADRRADFSCTGPHIDLCAPGVNILSTVPRYPSEFADTVDYDSWPGTSMATPLVAAAIALLLAKDNALTHGDIAQLLRQSADLVPGQLGWDEAHGAGRLNVYRALTS
jgi:subtilisin family serine protease